MTHHTDEMLALEVQKGNPQAFGELIERYEPKLMRYARRFLWEVDDAKDLVQDVFIKAYTNIQSFDSSRRFSPWIYRIAHNEFVNALQKKSTFPTVSLFDFDTLFPHLRSEDYAHTEAERRETREELEKHLGKLDVKYREVLILYYFEDMDYQEIAEVLKIPSSTVGVRLRRGRQALKQLLEAKNR